MWSSLEDINTNSSASESTEGLTEVGKSTNLGEVSKQPINYHSSMSDSSLNGKMEDLFSDNLPKRKSKKQIISERIESFC